MNHRLKVGEAGGVDVMELDERKKTILGAVIEGYIGTAEPVSSRTISKSYELGLSSATIRNEMADLEEMGLLEQPHTSAGRVPSDLGYRLYVDQLMKKYKLTMDEIISLRALLTMRLSEIDSLVDEIFSIYSKVTKYPIVAVLPHKKRSCVRHVQIMPLDSDTILLAVVTSSKEVKTTPIRLSALMSYESMSELTNVLNLFVRGLFYGDIDDAVRANVKRRIGVSGETVDCILNFVNDCISDVENLDVFFGGGTNLLKLPEYSNISRAREFLEFLEDKSNIRRILASLDEDEDTKVVIGSENQAEEMKQCSIILSKYKILENSQGLIGIIGPTRMDYPRMVSMLEFFTNQINNLEDDEE